MKIAISALATSLLLGCAAPDAGETNVSVEPDVTPRAAPPPGQCLSPVELPVDHEGVSTTTWGTHEIDNPCDWSITEYDVGSLSFRVGAEVRNPAQEGIIIPTATACEQSTITSRVYGLRRPRFEYEYGIWVFKPAAWELIAVDTESDKIWEDGSCRFYEYEQRWAFHGGVKILDSMYSHVRIATRAIYFSTNGVVAAPVGTFLRPYS